MPKTEMAANPEVVKRLLAHLTKAFEEFADQEAEEGGLQYLDALMGCHNFYKAIVLDLEERTQDKELAYAPNLIRRIAVDTLKEALLGDS